MYCQGCHHSRSLYTTSLLFVHMIRFTLSVLSLAAFLFTKYVERGRDSSTIIKVDNVIFAADFLREDFATF